MPLLNDFTETFGGVLTLELIDLIDEHKYGDLHLCYLLQEVHVLLRVLHHIRHIEEDVGIGKSRLRELEHVLLHLVVRLQHARSIGEDDLTIIRVDDTHDTVTRRLCLKCGNTNLFADELIHQRRLTDIRIADNVHETGFMCHVLEYLNS